MAWSHWQWPNIKGLKDFEGIVAHSASYPKDLDLSGKRIAIVGTGASGLQLTAALQKNASHMYTWIRTATWITSGFASKYAGPNGENFECK
jgi:cation diffusion facilitator CzcD-associated flavoprotein CzcO